MHDFTDRSLRVRMKPDGTNFIVAAGTTSPLTSDTLDMFGYANVLIRLQFGAIVTGAATTAKLQHSDDDSTYADIAGSLFTVADTADNNAIEWDINKPVKRYIKVVTTRATQNATLDALNAFLYNPINSPPTQGVTVSATKKLNSPPSGTA